MKRTLALLAILCASATAQAQDTYAPVVSAANFAPPSEVGGMAPALPPAGHGPMRPLVAPLTGDCGCGQGCVGRCQGCCAPVPCCPPPGPPRNWATMQYVHAYAKTRDIPDLVTTSDLPIDRDLAGVLPGATVLFGDEVDSGLSPALRMDIGRWNDRGTVGFGARLFYLEEDSGGFAASSTGDPVLALPYFDVNGPFENALLLAYPGVSTDGRISIDADMELISTEALAYFRLFDMPGFRFDLTGGYHFLRFDDSLLMRFSTTDADPGNFVPDGTIFDVVDSFSSRNKFHGGSIGFQTEIRENRVVLRSSGQVSIGTMHQVVAISGSEVQTVPDDPNPPIVGRFADGFFTQNSNIGVRDRDRTAFIPQAALSLGYRVTPKMEFNVGYSLLYMTNVALAGDHIDRNLDRTQDNTANAGTAPNFTFRDTSMFVHGVTIGATFTH